MNHGYLRVAAAVPKVNVADVDYNIASIEAITAETAAIGAMCHGLYMRRSVSQLDFD